MKVLYLDQSGQMGGGEIALLPWLRLMRDEADVLLFEDGPFRQRLEEAGVPVRVFRMSRLKQVRRESGWRSVLASLPALLRMRLDLRRITRTYDALYANSMKAFLVACFVRRRSQPLIWHLRDILSADHFSTLLRRVAVFAANLCASTVIVNSRATAAAFVAAGGRREKVEVVYDGISALPFQTLSETRIAEHRASFARGEELLIGVFSRLSHWKGQHVVLEAISSARGVRALIVGDALFGEDAYAEQLRQRALLPDLAGRVEFMGFRSDVAELMQTVDVVVHSSTSAEPFGLVIVEGMLAGKPVIATRAGGAIEIVRDGESGMLVAPGSVEELRAALVRLRDDAGERSRLGAEGKRHAQQAFPLGSMFHGIGGVMRRFVGPAAVREQTAGHRPQVDEDACSLHPN